MKELSLFEFNDGGLTRRGIVRSDGGGGRGYAEVVYSIGKLNYFDLLRYCYFSPSQVPARE